MNNRLISISSILLSRSFGPTSLGFSSLSSEGRVDLTPHLKFHLHFNLLSQLSDLFLVNPERLGMGWMCLSTDRDELTNLTVQGPELWGPYRFPIQVCSFNLLSLKSSGHWKGN